MAFHPTEALTQAFVIPLLVFVVPIHVGALGVVLTVMTVMGVTNHMGWEIFPAPWSMAESANGSSPPAIISAITRFIRPITDSISDLGPDLRHGQGIGEFKAGTGH
jgi:hypothetical protein